MRKWEGPSTDKETMEREQGCRTNATDFKIYYKVLVTETVW